MLYAYDEDVSILIRGRNMKHIDLTESIIFSTKMDAHLNMFWTLVYNGVSQKINDGYIVTINESGLT